MKKYLLFIVFLMETLFWARGQIVEGVDAIYGLSVENTIVRSIDGENTLIYVEDGLNKNFVLYDHANNQVYSFPVHQDAYIKDFEVYNGWAYFCGQVFNYALVGQFEIADVFFSGGPVYYKVMNDLCYNLDSTHLQAPVRVTDAWKMTLYDDGSQVNILAVGMGEHYYTEPIAYNASVMFSATLDPGLYWNFCVNYSKDKTFYYTDIDCTENFVGVTAIDGTGMGHVCINKKGAACFFALPERMLTYYWSEQVEGTNMGITGMTGDRFTVAYQPSGVNRVEFVQVPLPLPSAFQATSTYPSVNFPYGTNPFNLIELRYSKMTNKALLVGQVSMPPNDQWKDWVVDYEWSPAVGAWDMTLYGQPTSVDGHQGSPRFIATAGGNQLMFADENLIAPVVPGCIKYHNVDYISNLYPFKEWYVNVDEQECRYMTDTFYPEVIELIKEEICR